MSNVYTIQVGAERPKTLKRGSVEKGTGKAVGNEEGEILCKPSLNMFPNRALIWGKRVIEGEEEEDTVVRVEDELYRGQIVPLKWGSKGGYPINVRYLVGYPTIDLIYQDKVLNASDRIDENDAQSLDAFNISLDSGEQIFNEEKDPYLVLMLKVNHYNADSIYVNPDSKPANSAYYEVKYEEEKESQVAKNFDYKFEVFDIVYEARQDTSLTKARNLHSIVSDLSGSLDEVKDADLGKVLMTLAEEKPKEFLAKVNEYKRAVSDDFEKASAFKALDFSKDGVIVFKYKNEYAVIVEGIEGKKHQMVEGLIKNFMDAKSFEAAFQIKVAVAKLV